MKALAVKPNDLRSIPESHMIEGENRPCLKLLLISPQGHGDTHTHIISKLFKF